MQVGRVVGSGGLRAEAVARVVTRRPWLDNLKVLLIAAIIALHGVLSYAGMLEVWTYSELREVTLSPASEGILFVLVAPFGFFMITLLFLVAGLLTPGSVERKGVRRFTTDRLLRLGVPFVVFVFLLEPTLTYALEHPLGDAPGSYWQEYMGAERQLDTGPLWFVGVLLVFSLGYAAWVAAREHLGMTWRPRRVTIHALLTVVVVVAASSFLVRLVYPYGSEAGTTDMQFWEWPACLAAFTLGIVGHGQGWLDRVPDDLRARCRSITLITLPAMGALLLVAGLLDSVEAGLGGWNWFAGAFVLIEAPLAICGPLWLTGVAQDRLDLRYRGDSVLARACYAAFIVQGFVLVGLAVTLRDVALVAEVKAVVVAVLGVVGSFAVGWLLTRTPGVRRVV